MYIHIWSFGDQDSLGEYGPFIEEYRRRMPATLPFNLKLFDSPTGYRYKKQLRRNETRILSEKMQKLPAFYVVMDKSGKDWGSSELFATYLKNVMNTHSRMVFLVGGKFGFDLKIIAEKTPVYRLSKLTLPRHLVMLLLAEQLYHASTILYNKPYQHIVKHGY